MTDTTAVRVELDLTATLEAMLQHQAAGVGVDLATVPAEAIEYNRRVLLELLQVALPPLTEAIVDQMPAQGWLYVPDCTDEDLAKLELVRAAPVELPPAYTPCDGLNGSCFLPLGHDGDHL